MDTIPRRDALKKIGLLGGAVLAGCTPARILLHGYPHEFDADASLVDRVLASFADTVLPDAPRRSCPSCARLAVAS